MNKQPFNVAADDKLLTTEEVADVLRLTMQGVRELPIDRLRFGHRSLRFRESDVNAFLAAKSEVAA